MPFDGLDVSAWPWWALALIIILIQFREPLSKVFPSFFGLLTHKAQAERERVENMEEAERQDDIAVFQTMIRLQTETLRQNEKLLDFIINRLDTRLIELAANLKSELGAIRHELEDISQRWLQSTRESQQAANQHHLLKIEISRLVDRMEGMEKEMYAFRSGRSVEEMILD